MTLPSSLIDLAGWIEAHATTVGLLKWVIVGLLAWALGVFRFLRAKLKSPKLEIESFSRRCIWQEHGVVDGYEQDRKSVESGKSGAERVELGGRSILKEIKTK